MSQASRSSMLMEFRTGLLAKHGGLVDFLAYAWLVRRWLLTGLNNPPEYDRNKLCISLDGSELLNIHGEYGGSDTKYTTEVNATGLVVVPQEGGFMSTDASGSQSFYGTSDDSRVVGTSSGAVMEWRLKKKTDPHGNYVTYNYTASPAATTDSAKWKDMNTSYLESIVYTSNEKTNYIGRRMVLFEYSDRSDPVIGTEFGERVVQSHILIRIKIAVRSESGVEILRFYTLKYDISPVSGSSCLKSIQECANGSLPTQLTPTEFKYTGLALDAEKLFATDPNFPVTLKQTSNNIALLPLNISGRSLTDLACIRYNSATQNLTLKTFLAQPTSSDRQDRVRLSWESSTRIGSEVNLPSIEIGPGKPMPNFLGADLNGDGRADLIMPYNDKGHLSFSISQSNGTGFQPYRVRKTSNVWYNESSFMATDLSGNGFTDIIQIFPYQQKLSFRIFSAINQNGEATLKDAILLQTNYDYSRTIDWLEVASQRDASKSLVRVYSEPDQKGFVKLSATTFTLHTDQKSQSQLKESKPSILGVFDLMSSSKVTVLSCDINGDGVQDIVTCFADTISKGPDVELTFTMTTFLNDGLGTFSKLDEAVKQTYRVPASQGPFKPGSFRVTNVYGADYPSLAYVFQELSSRDFVALVFQGSSTGQIGKYQFFRLAKAKSLPPGDVTIVAGDLNGTNLGDWLMYSLHNDTFSVSPIYSNGTTTDFMESARDSMGLLTQIEYVPMSNPTYYQPDVVWDKYQPKTTQDEYPLISAPNYIVSRLNMTNDKTVNALPYSNSIHKVYSGARVNLRGRGWKGFAKVRTYDASADATTSEYFFQQWPYAGLQKQIDIEQGRFPQSAVLQSHKFGYTAVSTLKGIWNIHNIHKISDQVDFIVDGQAVRSYGNLFSYDSAGNVVEEETWNENGTKYWTRYSYLMFDDKIPLPTCKKISTKVENIDMNTFEQGDLGLKIAEFDDQTGVLKQISEWSSSESEFARTTYQFDQYGNEIETTNALGLKTATTMDAAFHCFPITVTESGPSVSLVTQAIFDGKSGVQIAKVENTGALTYFEMDSFGRIASVRKKVSSVDSSTHGSVIDSIATDNSVLGSSDALQQVAKTALLPHQDLSLKFVQSPSGQYLLAHAASTHNAGPEGRVEHWDLYDCMGKVRKTAKRHGNSKLSWTYSEYDSRGCQILKSFASSLPEVQDIQGGLDWVPQRSACLVSTFDALKRQTSESRPGHGDDDRSLIVTRIGYFDGGGRVKRDVVQVLKDDGTETPLSSTEKKFAIIHEQEKLVAAIDEGGSKTAYAWDSLGRLTTVTDPAGGIESREYDSFNNLIKTSDPYRNETTKRFDLQGNILQTTNALAEKVVQEYDCKSRVNRVEAPDGALKLYKYDPSGRDLLTMIAVYRGGSSVELESQVDFEYDDQGRVTAETTFLPGHDPFKVYYSYDWQDQVVKKSLPDGSELDQTYSGGLLSKAVFQGSSFKAQVDYESYNAFEKPEKWTVSTDDSSAAAPFSNVKTYDAQGFPLAYRMATSSVLVDSHYSFNGLDQLSDIRESVSGDSKRYTYQAGRLASETANDTLQANYMFDASGNMTRNNTWELIHSTGKILGKASTGEIAEVEYDKAGRMSRRTAGGKSFDFSYDGFGQMKIIKESSATEFMQIVHDHHGHALAKYLADGSKQLHIGDDYEVLIRADGSKRIKRKFFGADCTLGVIWTDISPNGQKGKNCVKLFYSDTKGNITHVIGSDGSVDEQFRYDAFGMCKMSEKGNESTTYEGRPIDIQTGLLDFKARWYDPVFGRFTTPDNITDEDSLKLVDGMNRFAFENNDPINHIDPSGHWSSNFWNGALAALGLVLVALVLTFATSGGFLIAV